MWHNNYRILFFSFFYFQKEEERKKKEQKSCEILRDRRIMFIEKMNKEI